MTLGSHLFFKLHKKTTMSYNIDSWKTKKINNLVIPIKAFEKYIKIEPKITNIDTNEILIEIGEGVITGNLKDKEIHVKKILIRGEGSGHIMNDIIQPVLEESTGELEAILIWESGDSITKETLINGKYKSTIHEL